MKLERTWLQSRVARRLVLACVGSTLVPIVALSWLAYRHVTGQLHEQSERRLHLASKSTGLAVLGRLQELERDLSRLAAATANPDPQELPRAAAELRDRLAWLALTGPGGTRWLLGEGPALEAPSAEVAAHLDRGRMLVATEPDPGGEMSVLVRRRLENRRADLVAGVRSEFLLDISLENTLPTRGQFCVVDARGRPLRCSFPPAELPSFLREGASDETSGGFDWEHDALPYVAHYWTLYLRPRFLEEGWRVVLAEPRDEVLAPIARFRTTFPLAVAGCFLLVSLLTLAQVRRRLRPLDALRDGTERVAAGEFGVPVRVESRDEFETVAASFNHMSRRLGDQFQRLSKLIEVDRAILSATEVPQLGETLVAGLRDLYPCDIVAVTLFPPDRGEVVLSFLSRAPDASTEPIEEGAPPPAETEAFAAPEPRTWDLSQDCPRPLRRVKEAGARSALVLPLLLSGRLAGWIACGHRSPDTADPGTTPFAHRIADQASLALANAYALEENRVLAYYDSLTKLPNRLMFRERVEQEILRRSRAPSPFAVCLMDLDGFKRVNDTLGHAEGDELLRSVAERLAPEIREGTIARLGGDEFTILVRDVSDVEDPARVAKSVLRRLSAPFQVGSREMFVTASIGIAVYPDDGKELDTLLRNADTAMYSAKGQGGNGYRFFTDAMHTSALHRLDLEQELRKAVEREEFDVVYQPVVDARTREIVSAEALVVWHHPERGTLTPDEFIPVAEQTGLIVPIGAFVLKRACQQTRAWQRLGLPHLSVSVNLSPVQVTEGSMVRTVREALLASELYPQYLVLELTETSLMRPDTENGQALQRLHDVGVRIAVDDFGTGYSSLAYLRQFPFDSLKIDRTFVSGLPRRADDAAIVRAMLAMARSLNLPVVAEGVEREEQLAFLVQEGCERAQGYLFSRPLPADGFEKVLRETSASREAP